MNTSKRQAARLLAVTMMLLTTAAWGQQPTQTPSAVLPAKGRVSFRQLFEYRHYGADPEARQRKVDQWSGSTELKFGLRDDLGLAVKVPLMLRATKINSHSDYETGTGDIDLLFTWRFYRADTGPTDTTRAAALFGVQINSGKAPFGSDSFDPVIGAAVTRVEGRHGINAAARWTFNTGGRDNPVSAGQSEADMFNGDAAYLYRLAPTAYTADTKASWYAMIEANWIYETNGDHELYLSPGILYEAYEIAIELSVQLPVVQALDHRAETDVAVVMGMRLLF